MGGVTNDDNKKNTAVKQCGLTEAIIFVLAIASGTACSICSKTMMELHGIGIDGDMELFQKPIFQTFGMFVGMMFGIVMHWAVVTFHIPFPGYDHSSSSCSSKAGIFNGTTLTKKDYGSIMDANETKNLLEKENNPTNTSSDSQSIPLWMYFFLAIPSIFDLGATVLCMMGLQYIDVSIYQLLRGSGIIFVALMKQHVLGDRLFMFQWLGVFWNVVSVFFVGAVAILNERDGQPPEDDVSNAITSSKSGQALWGVVLVMGGAVVQAMQFVFEEKVMTMEIPSPPLLLIGMEGLWGTVLCLVIIYPLAYYLPGDDHGSYEDPFNTMAMFYNSSSIQVAFTIYFFVIFAYNFLAVMVTFMLNSVWHAILDNFRPITVWITDLCIFYLITSSGSFGEPWTKWSYLQVLGMLILLYGTAVYNAPNAASIQLRGEWFAFGLDLSKEYDEIESDKPPQVDLESEQDDDEWAERMDNFKNRTSSSFIGERSPHTSVHTQALRGLASPKI